MPGSQPDTGTHTYDYATLDSTHIRLPIAFGTDRMYDPSRRPGDRLGSTPADSLRLGIVWVNVPSYHRRRKGEENKPPIWRVNPLYSSPSTERDMFVDSIALVDSSAFYRQLTDWVSSASDSLVLIFVHGYNVSFADAALRTAQLAVDVGFPGVPMFYDWTSQGDMVGYEADRENALNSADHLARFLRGVASQRNGWKIHLVVHSMGSQVVERAIEELNHEAPSIHFDQIVLIAPDLDVRPFRRIGLSIIKKHCERVTLYASDADRALQASRALHHIWRLGLGGDSLVVLPDMDTIDATRVRTDLLGHSSFGSVSFLDDLAAVLDEGRGPPRQLLRVPRSNLAFWRFRP